MPYSRKSHDLFVELRYVVVLFRQKKRCLAHCWPRWQYALESNPPCRFLGSICTRSYRWTTIFRARKCVCVIKRTCIWGRVEGMKERFCLGNQFELHLRPSRFLTCNFKVGFGRKSAHIEVEEGERGWVVGNIKLRKTNSHISKGHI